MKHTFLLLLCSVALCACHGTVEVIPTPQKAVCYGGYYTCKGEPQLDVRFVQGPAEGYKLRVGRRSIKIEASDSAGLFYAEQTLRQLREGDKYPLCKISDAPQYEYRGVMLDVSRHFFGLDYLKRQINILSSYKINRLHLHLTDAAGWRMEIKRYPLLAQKAAWRTAALWKDWWFGDREYSDSTNGYGGYYTRDELRELVTYAAERHITIVPEIEMPGHSEEVLAAYPDLSCSGKGGSDFCPGNQQTYEFLQNVLDEVLEVFPSEYIHIGGDEAGKGAWKTCPKCLAKAAELGYEDTDALQGYLIRRMSDYLGSKGRKVICWDEVCDDATAENSTIMIWRGGDAAKKAQESGRPLILTPGSYYYIDKYQDAPLTQPVAAGGYLPLKKVFEYSPSAEAYGLQVNLWAERVPSERVAERMLYPRALALAQTSWSGPEAVSYEEFKGVVLRELDYLSAIGCHPFDLSREVGDREEYLTPIEHLAKGKSVKYLSLYSPSYPANGPESLTDGLRGNWNYDDGRWQGFIGQEGFDVVVDLDSEQQVDHISLCFVQMTGVEIFLPTSIRFQASLDGENFETLSELTPEPTDEPTIYREFSWKGSRAARFLRVKASPGNGWIFTDEIIVH